MSIDLNKNNDKIDRALIDIDPEYFKFSSIPKGWVDIDEHLPMWLAEDVGQGYTTYKVRDHNGNEFESAVSDSILWYQIAKQRNITHWFNR